MNTKTALRSETAFKGRWQISAPDSQKVGAKQKNSNLVTFGKKSTLCYGAIEGRLDVRYGKRDEFPFAEFTWESIDEGDLRHGRGWAMLGPNGRIAGRIFIHAGKEAAFAGFPLT